MHHRQTHSEIRRTPHPPCGGPAIRSLSQFTTRHPIQLHNSHRRSRFWLCMTTRPDLVSLATRVPSLESIWTMRPVGDLRARLKVSRRSTFAAAGTLKYMMLIAAHHHGVVLDYLHQMHLSAARHTTHRTHPLLKAGASKHYDDLLKRLRSELSTGMCAARL
jgi:hypothetical protein